MKFRLKEFRGKNKISRKEFARHMNLTLDEVRNLEESDELDNEIIEKISDIFDISRLDVISNEVTDFSELSEDKLKWNEIDEIVDKLKIILDVLDSYKLTLDISKSCVEDLKRFAESVNKPIVAFLGMSDTGKSSLINYLLKDKKMPTSWNPTTTIPVYIKHISDKPSFITSDVCLLRESVGDEMIWNPKRFKDKEYHDLWYVSECSSDELRDYVTRFGVSNNIGSAVVYLGSDILKECDIVDLPGFGTGENKKEDLSSFNVMKYVDSVVYLSIANGFLRAHDIEFLKYAMKSVPVIEKKYNNDFSPLNNIFILSSQAHVINYGDKEQIHSILDRGASVFYNQIPKEIWDLKKETSKYNYSIEDIKNRFFSFTLDRKSLRERFESDFLFFLNRYAKNTKTLAKDYMKKILQEKNVVLQKELSKREAVIANKKKLDDEIFVLESNKAKRLALIRDAKTKALEEIRVLRQKSIDEFEVEYIKIINSEYICNVIKEKGYKKKKEDFELLAGYIGEKLNARLTVILNQKSNNLKGILNCYIEDFERSVNLNNNYSGIIVGFDTKRVMAGACSGLATFGALGIWSSLCGNLGGYIIVAKGVSLLSSMGVSFAATNGTAGIMSIVAAIGGPITVGIAITSMIGFIVFKVMNIGWQKKIADKIVESYKEQGAENKIINDYINKYWDDVRESFITLSANMEFEIEKYINDIRVRRDKFDIEKEISMKLEIEKVRAIIAGLDLSEH